MHDLRTDISKIVPVLVHCLKDENIDVSMAAAQSLGRLRAEPDSAVPALIESLKDSRRSVQGVAAEALGQFGEQAKAAVPALPQAINDPDGAHRLHSVATNALLKIAPEVLKTNAMGVEH